MTRVDPARFGAALAALWAVHDLADHVVQTDHQAATKASSWRGMAGHIGTYHLVQAATLAALRALAGIRPSWRRTLAAVALSAGTHTLLDRRWPVVAILEATGSPGFAASTEVPAALVDGTHPNWRQEQLDPAIGITRNVRLPLHGPYLADQALHHGCLAVAAAVLAGGAR
jgi:hypothetical protein